MGEVTKPGTMQLHGPTDDPPGTGDGRRLQGVREHEGHKVLRPRGGSNTSMETIRFNYKDVINGDAMPFYLQSGRHGHRAVAES